MIAEAIERILKLGKPEVVQIEGRNYSDRGMHPVLDPIPGPIKIHTLTGLVDYMKNDFGLKEVDSVAAIHVESHERVRLISGVSGPFKQRICHVDVDISGIYKCFPYGQWLTVESFIIELQAKFVQDEATRNLLTFVGNIKEEHVRQSRDDGVSQTVIAKIGIAQVAEVQVPNPVELKPYRTFLEVDQPSSSFVFRMKSGGKGHEDGPMCSLHEADGGAWRLAAIEEVKHFLHYKKPDYISIIA